MEGSELLESPVTLTKKNRDLISKALYFSVSAGLIDEDEACELMTKIASSGYTETFTDEELDAFIGSIRFIED